MIHSILILHENIKFCLVRLFWYSIIDHFSKLNRVATMSEKKDSSRSPKETNGPVVKSGPTAGNNRSRNDNGQWRAKRSDAGKPRGK